MAANSYGPKREPQYAGSGVPNDAADLTEVAAYAALVGNRKVGLSSERAALPTNEVWPGLQFKERDTGDTYEWVSTSQSTGWALISGASNLFNESPEGTKNVPAGSALNIGTVTLNVTTKRRVAIAATAQGQVGSAGANAAGNLSLFVDGVQIGGIRRYSTLVAAGNSPIAADRTVYTTLAPGSHTIAYRASVDPASGTSIFFNNPQIEVWAI